MVMHDTNTAERIVETIMFKTRLAEITQHEIRGLRAELEELMTSVGMDALTRPTGATETVVMSSSPVMQTQPQEYRKLEPAKSEPAFEPKRQNNSIDLPDLPGEEWRTFPDISRYLVSNKGRVKGIGQSLPGRDGSTRQMPDRILKAKFVGSSRVVSMRTPSGTYTSFSVASLMKRLWGGE